jgi:mannan endo-1,4-beta-mannosidase
MKARLALVAATVMTLVISMIVATQPAQAQSGGFRVSGTDLIDANGNRFIMRGTSLPHVWFQHQFQQFEDVSNLGANAARVVLGSGQRWGPTPASEVATVIAECKRVQMICILEVHDTTGYGEEGAAATLDQAVDYWISVRSALQGQEAYVLINIGNEPWGNSNTGPWTNATINAIQRMRQAGFTHTLVVDAPNWGQDWSNTMRQNAQQIAAADTRNNTVFSIHMYEVYGSASTITDYFNAFEQMNLPLIVGEFGHEHNGQNVDEDTIMAEAQQRGIGWIAWSWSGNSGGAESLDQAVNFNPNNLTQWGQRVFNGPNGIAQTAQRASVFGGTPPPSSPPPSSPPPSSPPPSSAPPPPPSSSPPVIGACQVSYSASDWGGAPGFTASVTITNTGSSTINGWTLRFNFTAGQQVQDGWSAQWSQQGATVTATHMSWNSTLAPGQSTQVGFNGSMTSVGNNPNPTSFTLNGADCTTG